MHLFGVLTLLLLLTSLSVGFPQDDSGMLWSEVKALLFEEPTPAEYFPPDEDFIPVEKDALTPAPDGSINP